MFHKPFVKVYDGILVFASQPYDKHSKTDAEDCIRTLFMECKKHKKHLLIVKTHPRETRVDMYTKIALEVGVDIVIIRNA